MRVNDVHSRLNPTRVGAVIKPASPGELARMIARAAERGRPFAIAGKRHAMGGQQFATDADLIDTTALNRIISLDRERGILEAEAGATWPEIIGHCWSVQRDAAVPWGIVQKQSGADALTLGGALSANAHGRGLAMRPIVRDVESFTLATPAGEMVECSRACNAGLFKQAIGGYGLFGVIGSVKLRLMPRIRLRRVVMEMEISGLMPAFEGRIRQGCLYGDWQYMIDPKSPDYLRKGIFSCYLPVDASSVMEGGGLPELSAEKWEELYRLAFTDKGAAYKAYSEYYLATDGQLYWSDTHQLAVYLENYHGILENASLMISELYVPRRTFVAFMDDARKIALDDRLDIIYGTVRLIERDDETFLAWAKEDYACVIFNLRVHHSLAGIEKAARDFRSLIDAAIDRGGSYYLTYHRWARKDQVAACYPQFRDFLDMKSRHDPAGLLRSDWHAHYQEMFAH